LLDGLTSRHFENGGRFGAQVGQRMVIAAVPQFRFLLFAQDHWSSSHTLSSSQTGVTPVSEEDTIIHINF
jgi:hypothetical protein